MVAHTGSFSILANEAAALVIINVKVRKNMPNAVKNISESVTILLGLRAMAVVTLPADTV
jgi:hypothetical protein